LMLIRSFRSI
ncbi:unnamed protein product, partial [Rotaria magnacalcarata]